MERSLTTRGLKNVRNWFLLTWTGTLLLFLSTSAASPRHHFPVSVRDSGSSGGRQFFVFVTDSVKISDRQAGLKLTADGLVLNTRSWRSLPQSKLHNYLVLVKLILAFVKTS